MFALSIFVLFMSRRNKAATPGAIRHHFSSGAPEGHRPDESGIPYWAIQLPEHY